MRERGLPDLTWVYSASAGVDFRPPWRLEASIVTCGHGEASEEIADYVIAAIYLEAKNLEAVRARSVGQWINVPLGRMARGEDLLDRVDVAAGYRSASAQAQDQARCG